MKILKNLFLLLIVLAFSVTLLIFLFNISLKSTLLSTSYFTKMIDESEMSKVLVEAIKLPDSKSLYDEAWDNSKLAPLKATLVESIDKNGFEQQAQILLKGVHSYVLGDLNTLPVLDFGTLKKNFLQRVMTDFDRVTKNASAHEKARILEILNQRIKKDNIKENFDLNELGAKLYSNGINPLSTLRELVYSYNKTILIPFAFLTVLFILVLSAICYNLKSTFVWSGSGTLFSGILGLLSGIVFGRIKMIGIIPGLEAAINNPDAKIIIEHFLRDFFNIILIGGIILTLLGSVLILVGIVALNKKVPVSIKLSDLNQSIIENESSMALKRVNDKNQLVKSNNKYQIIIKAIAVIILAFVISTIVLGTNSFRKSISNFSDSLDNTSKLLDDIAFTEAAIQVSGAEFLNEKIDPTYAIIDSTEEYLAGVLVEFLDENGKPVKDVEIAIHKDSPHGPKLMILYLLSGIDGKMFEFSLEKGTYYIEVLNNGKIPVNIKLPEKPTKVVIEGPEDIDVTITLENK